MAQQLPLLGTLAVEAEALSPPAYDKALRRYPTLRELPESERPVNRLLFYGVGALRNWVSGPQLFCLVFVDFTFG